MAPKKKRKSSVKPAKATRRIFVSHSGGFDQEELVRALRAIRSVGMSVGNVEIANGDHRITITPTDGRVGASGYLTMREACEYGKFGKSHAYLLIASGVLRAKKLGKRTLIAKSSIDRLLKSLRSKKASPSRG
jgi:excisionase family DNA binding protein